MFPLQVSMKEAEFLQKLLPGYYMNLQQNPRTLLPKFFGMYTYQVGRACDESADLPPNEYFRIPL
jgi:hypothetical protein